MFFTDFDITSSNQQSSNADVDLFVKKITSRMLPLKNKEIVLNRKYINGDTFVTTKGEVYLLTDINKLTEQSMNGTNIYISDFFENIGLFDKEDNIFDSNDLDISQLVIKDSEDSLINSDSLLTIQSNKITKSNKVEFINLNALYGSAGNMDLNILYDSNLKAFKLESQYPIVIDSNVYINQNNNT
jgi:hypothetical protein